jgi:hypothetical protein
MSVQNLQFSYVSGQTLTVHLLALGGSTSLFQSATATEAPASSGVYLAAFTNATPISGSVRAVVYLGGGGVAAFKASFNGVDLETVQAGEFVVSERLTQSEVAAAVLDAQTSSHQTPGSVGLAISESGSDISVILPASGTVPERSLGETIRIFNLEQIVIAVAVFGLDKNPVDLTGRSLWFGAWDRSRDKIVEATPTGTATGFTVTIPKTNGNGSNNTWVVRDGSGTGEVILTGPLEILKRPTEG